MVHVVVTLKGRLIGRHDIPGGLVRIGRHPDNEVQIDNQGVSRYHTLLRRDDQTGLWSVEDQGSQNGTYVNGAKVKTKTLRGGDAITVGRFTVTLLQDTHPTQTGPPSGRPGDSGAVSFRPSGRPAERERRAAEKGHLEFDDRSGHVLLSRDVCQLGSAPGLDVHLGVRHAKAVLIVRGYGGFQLVNPHPDQPILVNGHDVRDREWLEDGAVIQVEGERFTFRAGLPVAAAEKTRMDISLPKGLVERLRAEKEARQAKPDA
jgi:pSer/pThr/pTyr-binding forkhead associated (FHA) protein